METVRLRRGSNVPLQEKRWYGGKTIFMGDCRTLRI